MTSEAALHAPAERGDWSLPSRRKVAILMLILTETALFSIFVAAYVFYIGKSLNGPYPRDVLELPILASICLLSSSVTIMLAERAFAHGGAGSFRLWWFVTIALGAIFLAFTGREWYELIYVYGLTMSTNLFGSTYYSLVGLHASHVIVGLIMLATVLIASLRGALERRHEEHLQMVSWYWHFVDVVWIVVFTVVYIIGR